MQYAPHLLNIMLEADSGVADYQAQRILGRQYFRMDPILPREIGLGSIKYMPVLLETANQADLSGMIEWLKSSFMAGIKEKPE